MNDHHLPPQSLEAEACLLGSCLLHTPVIDEAVAICQPEMLYSESNQTIYATLLRMRDGNLPIDPVTVSEELDRNGKLAECGGIPRLLEVIATVPHAGHVGYYAETVRDRYRRRVAATAAHAINARVRDLTEETDAVLHDAEEQIHCALEGGTKPTAKSIDEILLELMTPEGKARIQPIPTGWQTLDEIAGGITPGQLVILAARTSVGKSAAAVTLMRRMAETGEAGLLVSYEMSRLELAERLMVGALGVDCWTFRHAHGNRQLQTDILQQAEILGKLPVAIDESKPTLPQLLALLRLQVRRRKVRIVVVDYLQLIPFVGKAGNREQEIAQITRQLKTAAGQLGIVIIALSQLNRDVEKRESQRPRLSDLRESGAIEQDADQVWLLWRQNMSAANSGGSDVEPDNIGELIIAKNRGGRLGIVPLSWHGPTMVYRDRGEIPDAVQSWGAA